jgi:transcriptional regulator with XRE-family HTH domain
MSKEQSPFREIKSPNGDNQVKSIVISEFGARLRQAAQDRGMNQRLLAQSLDIPTSTIGRYWNGQRLLPADLLFRAADCLAVDPRWLALGEIRNDGDLGPDEHELLKRFRGLTPLQRDHLLQSATLLGGTDTAPSTLHSPKLEYRHKPPER